MSPKLVTLCHASQNVKLCQLVTFEGSKEVPAPPLQHLCLDLCCKFAALCLIPCFCRLDSTWNVEVTVGIEAYGNSWFAPWATQIYKVARDARSRRGLACVYTKSCPFSARSPELLQYRFTVLTWDLSWPVWSPVSRITVALCWGAYVSPPYLVPALQKLTATPPIPATSALAVPSLP